MQQLKKTMKPACPDPFQNALKNYSRNSKTFELSKSDQDIISWCMSANVMYGSIDTDPIDIILRSEVINLNVRQQKIVLHCLSFCATLIYNADKVHEKVVAQCQ